MSVDGTDVLKGVRTADWNLCLANICNRGFARKQNAGVLRATVHLLNIPLTVHVPLTVHPPEHPPQLLSQLWLKSISAVSVNKGAENWKTNGTLCGTLKNNCTVHKTYNYVQVYGYLLNSTQYRILAFVPMHQAYEMRCVGSRLDAVLFISASARFVWFSTILARTSR